jgi:hypothetical protein
MVIISDSVIRDRLFKTAGLMAAVSRQSKSFLVKTLLKKNRAWLNRIKTKVPQCSRIRRLPETILFSNIAPGGTSIRSP